MQFWLEMYLSKNLHHIMWRWDFEVSQFLVAKSMSAISFCVIHYIYLNNVVHDVTSIDHVYQ